MYLFRLDSLFRVPDIIYFVIYDIQKKIYNDNYISIFFMGGISGAVSWVYPADIIKLINKNSENSQIIKNIWNENFYRGFSLMRAVPL